MKAAKSHSRLAVRSPQRSVSLQVSDYKVTVKVKSPVPVKRQQSTRWQH